VSEPESRRRGNGRLRVVQQAEAVIQASPAAPHTVESLARAVGVSVRSLGRAFESQRGHGPIEALRRERLLRVRQDLLLANADERVTAVAMRWGFVHLGRFSRVYATHFGELPSETRRRARARPPQPADAPTTSASDA
jgi:transcriptional regulator GlxA family with amidase domain